MEWNGTGVSPDIVIGRNIGENKLFTFIETKTGDSSTLNNNQKHVYPQLVEKLNRISAELASVAEEVTLDYDFTFDKLSAGFEQDCV